VARLWPYARRGPACGAAGGGRPDRAGRRLGRLGDRPSRPALDEAPGTGPRRDADSECVDATVAHWLAVTSAVRTAGRGKGETTSCGGSRRCGRRARLPGARRSGAARAGNRTSHAGHEGRAGPFAAGLSDMHALRTLEAVGANAAPNPGAARGGGMAFVCWTWAGLNSGPASLQAYISNLRRELEPDRAAAQPGARAARRRHASPLGATTAGCGWQLHHPEKTLRQAIVRSCPLKRGCPASAGRRAVTDHQRRPCWPGRARRRASSSPWLGSPAAHPYT
jgi:hypothetical protein